MFHIPQHLAWEPTAVHQALQARGFNSRVEGVNVVIDFRRPGICGRFLDSVGKYLPRFRSSLTIEHCSNCVIDSVKIHCHPKVPFGDAIQHIESVMKNCDYVPIATDETVRAIALRLSPPTPELIAALDELKSHKSISCCGADTNSWARDHNVILTKIEHLVLNAGVN